MKIGDVDHAVAARDRWHRFAQVLAAGDLETTHDVRLDDQLGPGPRHAGDVIVPLHGAKVEAGGWAAVSVPWPVLRPFVVQRVAEAEQDLRGAGVTLDDRWLAERILVMSSEARRRRQVRLTEPGLAGFGARVHLAMLPPGDPTETDISDVAQWIGDGGLIIAEDTLFLSDGTLRLQTAPARGTVPFGTAGKTPA